MKKITAIIPVRKGSVRVKNKNLKPFADTNLLEIKIKQLKQINFIDKIVVSSDCDKMLKIAVDYGVDTHKRDKYFASSKADNSEYFHNLAESIQGEYLMYSPVTCPLISKETYFDCINTFQNEDVENLITAAPVKHHMWLDGKPLNQITYGVCIISRDNMIEYRNVVTDNPTFKILDEIESVDIDTEFDFMIAETIYKKLNGYTK